MGDFTIYTFMQVHITDNLAARLPAHPGLFTPKYHCKSDFQCTPNKHLVVCGDASWDWWTKLLNPLKGYDTVDCRRTFGVVVPILKGRQLCIQYSNGGWSFSTNRISVTRITTAQMAHIGIKWDLIAKT